MKVKKLKVATVSDIHLGHARNETLYIIDNLRAAFPDDAKTAALDILFIAGDVFDSQLTLSDGDILHIHAWIAYLLRLCKKHDILLRVLGGTHSHDWGQSKLFEYINASAQIDADLKYVPDLSIENIERFGIDVLYVPDEWDDDPNKTLDQVHELMRLKGIKKVDIAVMHGQFEYQLPPVVKAPKHSSQAYLDIVKSLIFIGHVHVPSTFERIVAQGSFDRLTHGEEHPKGHVRAVIYDNGKYELEFVENKNARKFLTVECRGLTIEDTLQEIEHFVKDLPDGSFVRVSCSPDNPILSEMNLLVREWPMITWSKISREDAFAATPEIISEETTVEYIPITITRDNIAKLLIERIKNKLPPDLLEIAEAAIEELR